MSYAADRTRFALVPFGNELFLFYRIEMRVTCPRGNRNSEHANRPIGKCSRVIEIQTRRELKENADFVDLVFQHRRKTLHEFSTPRCLLRTKFRPPLSICIIDMHQLTRTRRGSSNSLCDVNSLFNKRTQRKPVAFIGLRPG